MNTLRYLLVLLVMFGVAFAQEQEERTRNFGVGFVSSTSVGLIGISLETHLNPVTLQGVVSLLSGSGSVAGRLKYDLSQEGDYTVFGYTEVGYRVGDLYGLGSQDRWIYGGGFGARFPWSMQSGKRPPLFQTLEVGLSSSPLFGRGVSISITSSLHFHF